MFFIFLDFFGLFIDMITHEHVYFSLHTLPFPCFQFQCQRLIYVIVLFNSYKKNLRVLVIFIFNSYRIKQKTIQIVNIISNKKNKKKNKKTAGLQPTTRGQTLEPPLTSTFHDSLSQCYVFVPRCRCTLFLNSMCRILSANPIVYYFACTWHLHVPVQSCLLILIKTIVFRLYKLCAGLAPGKKSESDLACRSEQPSRGDLLGCLAYTVSWDVVAK